MMPQEAEASEDGVVTVRTEQHVYHAGPIPPPADLARYEQILPGSAERILTSSEINAEHIRRIRTRAMDHDHEELALRSRDRKSAFVVIGMVIVGSIILAAINAEKTAIALLGLGGVVASIFKVVNWQEKKAQ